MGATEELIKAIGENDSNQDVSDWLSTGILPLNKAISGKFNGGFPMGRVSEIYGGESSGKTLIATRALIETQKKGGIAALLDFEHAFSLSRAEKLGLVTEPGKWIYKQPTTAEEGFGIIEKICDIVRKADSTKPVTIAVDSIASMVTKAEMDAGFDEGNMKTRLSLSVCMSSSLKIITGIISKTNVTLIFLNQTRDNPGIMFGDKESQPGGKAMKFYASLRIRLGKKGKIKDGDEIIGEEIMAKTIKNKVYRPFKECLYHSNFDTGVDIESTHISYLVDKGILTGPTGYILYQDKKRRQKELVKMCREDAVVNADILSMFIDEVET